jgi:hypothetical protein
MSSNFSAYAGHTIANGAYCTCGCSGCMCDSGEALFECNSMTTAEAKTIDENVDLSGMMILLVAIYMLYRIR